MCDKAVTTWLFLFDSTPEFCKTQEMWGKVIYKFFFILKYFLDKYKSQKMCDKTVDDYLSTLKFVPGWFVIDKMIRKH